MYLVKQATLRGLYWDLPHALAEYLELLPIVFVLFVLVKLVKQVNLGVS